MKINITHRDFDLTEAISGYAEEKFQSLQKYLNDSQAFINVEIRKTSLHHKQGNMYEVKADLNYGSRALHITNVNEDVYASIDEAKDKLADEMAHNGDRERSLVRSFARRFKKLIKREE
ncbi:MAG: putative sigma-54 modulation protein [Patescibacteria group bacterium]|nr:putative sigma-54 modulation protein [Patescibacteria group bacterium]